MPIRNLILFFFAIMLALSASLALSENSGIDIIDIQSREGFSIDDGNSDWTYYAFALANGTKGETVEIMLVSWGKNRSLKHHPEIRFFVSDVTNKELKPDKATVMIGSNMFEINLKPLSLENTVGAYAKLVWEDDVLINSLATGNDCKVILQCGNSSVQALFTETDLRDIKNYSVDMLRYEFTKTIDTGNETNNVISHLDSSSITAHIFEEIDKNQILEKNPKRVVNEKILEVGKDGKEEKDEWKDYSIDEIGLKISIPSHYNVFTRNMKDSDPATVNVGLSGAEISSILTSKDIYMDVIITADNELTVSVEKSIFQDYLDIKDSMLLQMARNYSISWGISAENIDIYRNNDLVFMRIKGSYNDINGRKLGIYIYYTDINSTEYRFSLSSLNDRISSNVEAVMDSIMESVILSSSDISRISSYKKCPSEFTYVLLDDGSACITGYSGTTRDIMIPRIVDGHTVKSISEMEKNRFVENIFIPETVEFITGNPFKNLYSIKSFKVSEESKYFTSYDGALYTYDKTVLISYPSPEKKDVVPVIIPSTVKVIGDEAFYNDFFLNEIILPEGLERIGDNAFYFVTELKSIIIPSTVNEIGSNPFYAANSLEEIIVAADNSTFDVYNGALYNKSEKSLVAFPKALSAEGFSFPSTLKKINDYAFYEVKGLADQAFPDTVTWIGDYAFYGCKDCSFQALPQNIKHVGKWAFDQVAFDQLTIPGNTKLDYACFYAVRVKDKNVIINEGISDIPPLAFDSANISSALLPESLISIGRLAFAHCTYMTSLKIPNSVVSIGENAFLNCTWLTAIVEKGSYVDSYCYQNNINTFDAQLYPKITQEEASTGDVVNSEIKKNDPFLSRFPSISWGMTKDELLEGIKDKKLKSVNLRRGTGLTSIENIYWDIVSITFIYIDEKLSMISVKYSENYMAFFAAALTMSYGIPIKTTFLDAFYNNFRENQDGDIYCWKTNGSVIALYLNERGSIEYWPLKHKTTLIPNYK